MKQHYYTQARRQVTEAIENGSTLFITELREAISTSIKLRTYYYELFNQENEFIGYGVPRN